MSPAIATPAYDALNPDQRAIIEEILRTGSLNVRESLAQVLFAPPGSAVLLHQFEMAVRTDANSGAGQRLICFLAWENIALVLNGAASGFAESLRFMNEQAQKLQGTQAGQEEPKVTLQ